VQRIARIVVTAAVAGIGLGAGGIALAGQQGNAPCAGTANEPPAVYTDGFQTYTGVCAGGAYLEADNARGAVEGNNALVQGRTGNDRVDGMLWGNGSTPYGPAEVWVNGGGPASTKPGCAPAGDDTYLYGNGNNVTRELPTVYTDGGATRTGVCGGSDGAYVQVNNARGALAGDNALVEVRTGNDTVDANTWGDGHTSYGPAEVWVAGGGPAGTAPSCARAGDDRYGHANGNTVTRELPTVYTDGGKSHAGVCGGGGRAEVRDVGDAANDPAGTVAVEGLPTP
jgi:hypothetical protein